MAANTVPKFIDKPLIGMGSLSSAETSRTAPTSTAKIATGKPAGTVIELLRAVATATTTAGMIRFFLFDGVTYFFWKELPVAAITPSPTVPAWEKEFVPTGGSMTLPDTIELHAATEKGEAFKVFAFGGDL